MQRRGWWCVAGLLLGAMEAGAGAGTWENFTAMSSVRGVTRVGVTAWAATSGGLFGWEQGSGSFARLTSAEGLRSIDLTAVAADAGGVVWSGTSGGYLHAYAPSSGTLRIVSDIATTNQTNKRINSLAVAGDTLLVCTEFGLSVFRLSRFEFGDTFTRFGSIPPSVRVAVLAAAVFDGKIWAAVSDGLTNTFVAVASTSAPNLLPPEAWTLQQVGPPGTIPRTLTPFAGAIYAGTSAGLYRFTGTGWTAVASVGPSPVVATAPSASALAVCTSAGGVLQVNSAGNAAAYGPAVPAPATSVVCDSAGRPLVGSTGGGILSLGSSWETHFPNGPNSNQFISLGIGPDGVLWAGSGPVSGRGLYRYADGVWRSYTRANSAMPLDEAYRVSITGDGAAWVSTFGRGLVEIPPGATTIDSNRVYGRNVGLVGLVNDPLAIVPGNVVSDSRGTRWFSVINPADGNPLVAHTADGAWHRLPALVAGNRLSYIADPNVDRCLAVDAFDNLWAVVRDAAFRGLVSFRNRGAIDSVVRVQLTSANGLPSNDIRTIVVDRENDIWAGTDKGIGIILDPSNPTRAGAIASYKPLSGVLVNAIAVDPLNQKWVATNEGVVLLSPDGTQVLATYTADNTGGKLLDNDVKTVAVNDASGTVYFGTSVGLSSLTTPGAAPRTSFAEINVYPNPYRVPSSAPLTVDGLIANSSLRVLTVDGLLVRDLPTPGGRVGFWDGKDSSGSDVASGIYIVVAYSEDGSQVATAKVAVLRK